MYVLWQPIFNVWGEWGLSFLNVHFSKEDEIIFCIKSNSLKTTVNFWFLAESHSRPPDHWLPGSVLCQYQLSVCYSGSWGLATSDSPKRLPLSTVDVFAPKELRVLRVRVTTSVLDTFDINRTVNNSCLYVFLSVFKCIDSTAYPQYRLSSSFWTMCICIYDDFTNPYDLANIYIYCDPLL